MLRSGDRVRIDRPTSKNHGKTGVIVGWNSDKQQWDVKSDATGAIAPISPGWLIPILEVHGPAGDELDNLTSETVSTAGFTPYNPEPYDANPDGFANCTHPEQKQFPDGIYCMVCMERLSPPITVPFTVPESVPEVSPVTVPATGTKKKKLPKLHPPDVSASLLEGSDLSPVDSPGTVPGVFPGDCPGYRDKVSELLEEAIALLKPSALPGHWISTRTVNGKTYYRLRSMASDGDEEAKEQSIKASEVTAYQRRIDDGRALTRIQDAAQLLSDM